jgi:hypothetical protein
MRIGVVQTVLTHGLRLRARLQAARCKAKCKLLQSASRKVYVSTRKSETDARAFQPAWVICTWSTVHLGRSGHFKNSAPSVLHVASLRANRYNNLFHEYTPGLVGGAFANLYSLHCLANLD